MQNIVIVSPERATPVSFDGSCLDLGRAEARVWLRSALSGLKSLQMHLVVFLPGCTDEQKRLATERTRVVDGKIIDLGGSYE
jgi:hypothetical protein